MGNGSLPSSDLVLVQAGIYLHKNAAPAWVAAKARARKAYGFEPYITSPYGGYRSLAQQKFMWNNRYTSTTGVVAYPGNSVHGWGMSVDVANYLRFTREQLDAAMNPEGFFRTIKSEPWHYEKRSGGSSGWAPAPQQIESEEDDDMTTAILYVITEGGSGTEADYRAGKVYSPGGPLEHRTYKGQVFIQETPTGPLQWVEFSGRPPAYGQKHPTVTRTAAELRDKELTRFGHVPVIGGPVVYEGQAG